LAVPRIVVAIDGPAGAGKSTVTRRLARELGYELLDTGALYRTVALVARRRQVPWDHEERLARIAAGLEVRFELRGEKNHVFVAKEDVSDAIRTEEISQGASEVSALPGVRQALLELQRRRGAEGGVVAEGRDVGTVVFPDAPAKFFLTASAEVRARRRFEELRAAGSDASFDAVLADLEKRDERDSNRAVAPLVAAEDAVLVDSSHSGVEEIVAQMLAVVREREQGR
jgi:CMP/dCMP kinase